MYANNYGTDGSPNFYDAPVQPSGAHWFPGDPGGYDGEDDDNDQGDLGDGEGGEGRDAKRRRIARACDMCRKKKIKCDGKQPKCSHCENYKTECIFTPVEKKRAPPKGAKYIEGLENRLGRMEGLLRMSGLLAEEDGGKDRSGHAREEDWQSDRAVDRKKHWRQSAGATAARRQKVVQQNAEISIA